MAGYQLSIYGKVTWAYQPDKKKPLIARQQAGKNRSVMAQAIRKTTKEPGTQAALKKLYAVRYYLRAKKTGTTINQQAPFYISSNNSNSVEDRSASRLPFPSPK